MMIIRGTFDPITTDECRMLRACSHHEHVYIQVEKEGSIDCRIREKLVKQAVRPFKKLHLYTGKKEGTPIDPVYAEQEKLVRQGRFDLVPSSVRILLHQTGCYDQQILFAMCRESRAVHSVGVAETARHLAHVHHLDEQRAYRMGLLHDITKNVPDEWNRQIIADFKPEWLSISDKVWHSYTASIWLRRYMRVNDTVMLRAIEHHTLGDGNSLYDAICYIADKIEPNRKYDTTRQMKLAEKDLRAAQKQILKESREFEKGRKK